MSEEQPDRRAVLAALNASPQYQSALHDADFESWAGPGVDVRAMIEAVNERRADKEDAVMSETVTAPFTDGQVESLNGFQHSGFMHPFTCSGGGGPHSDRPGRPAALIASEDGWRCPVTGCVHRQNWAHAWMADGSWRQTRGGRI